MEDLMVPCDVCQVVQLAYETRTGLTLVSDVVGFALMCDGLRGEADDDALNELIVDSFPEATFCAHCYEKFAQIDVERVTNGELREAASDWKLVKMMSLVVQEDMIVKRRVFKWAFRKACDAPHPDEFPEGNE
jgi:hypothetical protein